MYKTIIYKEAAVYKKIEQGLSKISNNIDPKLIECISNIYPSEKQTDLICIMIHRSPMLTKSKKKNPLLTTDLTIDEITRMHSFQDITLIREKNKLIVSKMPNFDHKKAVFFDGDRYIHGRFFKKKNNYFTYKPNLSKNKNPIRLFVENNELTSIEKNISPFDRLGRVFPHAHIAIFPDFHKSNALIPIGTAIGFNNNKKIFINTLGYDLGCGFRYVIIKKEDIENNKTEIVNSFFDEITKVMGKATPGYKVDNKTYPINAIGKGNHFIELEEIVESHDKSLMHEGDIVITIHSGSGTLGNYIFDMFNKKIKQEPIALKEGIYVADWNSSIGLQYLKYIKSADNFSRYKRKTLMDTLVKQIAKRINKIIKPVFENDHIHNTISEKNNWIIYRKGVSEINRSPLFIAGSMGTPSALLTIEPNESNLFSINHGSGRVWSRSEAKELFSDNYTSPYTFNTNKKTKDIFSEYPEAYKDSSKIFKTMQKTLKAKIIALCKPLATYKE
ncbi:RtcB family protein [Candidatus Margulisiibacteriota bacterium]